MSKILPQNSQEVRPFLIGWLGSIAVACVNVVMSKISAWLPVHTGQPFSKLLLFKF
jgi:hypothetical protein